MGRVSKLIEVKPPIIVSGLRCEQVSIAAIKEKAAWTGHSNEEIIAAIGRLAEQSHQTVTAVHGLPFQPGEEQFASWKCGGGPHLNSLD